MILARLAEYLQNILNEVHITNAIFLDDLQTLPITPNLDNYSSLDNVEKVILSLKDRKAASLENISVNFVKYGGIASFYP